MYGLIGKMTAKPGQRDALQSILLQSIGGMPGCLSYVVAQDSTDADALWTTEVWDNEGSHAASLNLPAVQSAIAKARPDGYTLIMGNHSTLTFHPALPLAETASLFGETMMTDHLLAVEQDPAVRRDLLAGRLDDTYGNVMRQAYFTLFEQEAHALFAQGKSTDDLCAAYLKNLREQFGPAIPVGDEFKWEWVSIHHFFHVPFYTYAYSFGNLLALALYKEYLANGQAFIPRYVKILAYGGAASPTEILREAGIDITSAAFWQGGFDLAKTWAAELETLPAPSH